MKQEGALTWFEINVTDITAGIAFYSELTGKPLRPEDFDGTPTAVFTYPEGTTGGAIIADGKRPKGNGGAIVYLAVDTVGAALSRAEAAGGKIVLPPTSIGPNGFIGIVKDPDGNHVGVNAAT
jgi:uncharacterized protein